MRRSAALTGPAVLSIPRSWNIYLRAAEYRPPGRFTISAALPLGSSGEMYARADPDLCRKRVLLGEQPDHDNEPESLFMARDTRHVLLIETGPDDRPIRSRREASKAVADTTHAAARDIKGHSAMAAARRGRCTDIPGATSHWVRGIRVDRTGLRCTSFHRFRAAAIFYPNFYQTGTVAKSRGRISLSQPQN